jgi:hypothetical protein
VATLIIASILLGAFLSQFYRVFILFPVIVFVVVGEFGKAIYFGLGFWRPLFEFALISTSLQIGYVAIPAFFVILNLSRRVGLQRGQVRAGARYGTSSFSFPKPLISTHRPTTFGSSKRRLVGRVAKLRDGQLADVPTQEHKKTRRRSLRGGHQQRAQSQQ